MDGTIKIEGKALRDLVDATRFLRTAIRTLRISSDGFTVKFKINEGTWSPPYKLEAEQ